MFKITAPYTLLDPEVKKWILPSDKGKPGRYLFCVYIKQKRERTFDGKERRISFYRQ
jgi:hypothetical protein